MLTMSHSDGDTIRHLWVRAVLHAYDPGQDLRQVGTVEPLSNLFELAIERRGDSDEQLSY